VTLAWIGLGLVAVAFVIGAALCAVVRVAAPRVGLVDRPGGRKDHRRPTPLGGGVAIWLTVVLVLALGALVVHYHPGWLPEAARVHVSGLQDRGGSLLVLMGLATVIMLMGLADDRRPIGWKPRLAVQLGLAAIVAIFLGRVTLFGPLAHPLIGGVVTVLWIAGLTNAFNFLDNMDALAATVGLIAAALFAAAQVAVGERFVPAVLLVLVGALGGYLVHNAPPARLFMGDAGSNFLGFLLGSLTVLGTFTKPYDEGDSPAGVLAPLLVMAVPLYDSLSVMLIRYREGRSLFQADRRHFSHRLVDRGLSPPRAVATIGLVTLASGLGALLLHSLTSWREAAVVLGQTACLLGVVAVLESTTNGRPPETARGPHDGEPPQGQGPSEA
jgi:UDP-GlcNAc:undecaprenyl-phosphate GlcNAc-1-phosphate transferase